MPLPRNAQRFVVGYAMCPKSKSSFVRPNASRLPPEFASDWHPVEPSGGTGLGPAYAEAIGAALRAGFEPVVRETEKDAILLPEEIRAIAVGGDGTLRQRAAASLGEAVFLSCTRHWEQRICLLACWVCLGNPKTSLSWLSEAEPEKLMPDEHRTAPSPLWSRSDLMPR